MQEQTQQGPASPEMQEAQAELKRAYLLLSWGNFEEAIEVCQQVDDQLEAEHHLPKTLEGSFLIAKGDVREALKVLRGVTRKFSDQALPQIHFAEACYLAGRKKQGDRALKKAEKLDEDGEHAELLGDLRETWGDIDPSDVPPPLKVNEGESEEDR